MPATIDTAEGTIVLQPLFDAIVADFERFSSYTGPERTAQLTAAFRDTLAVSPTTAASKYARIVAQHGTGHDSVWGFVVLKDDGKFRRGDVLKADGWKGPAKNFVRGRVDDTDLSWVKWTSAS